MWLGKLFMVRPNYNTTIVFDPTAGPKDIVNAFVVILDLIDPQTGKPTVIDGANIGGAGLVPQLRNKVDQLVLGRLEQSPAQGQKSGAFKLNANYTAEDEALAGRWLTELGPVPPLPEAPPAPAPAPAGQWGQAPAQAPQAPAQQGWGQPASPPPADVWAGTNAAPQQGGWGAAPAAPQAPAGQWGQAPAAPQAPAQQGWGQQQAPAQQPPAGSWGQAPAAPAPAPQAVPQDPTLVAFLTGKGIQVTPDMDMNTLQTIASTIPQ